MRRCTVPLGCAHILDAPKSILHDQNDSGATEGQHGNGAAGSAGQDKLAHLSYERCTTEGHEESCMFLQELGVRCTAAYLCHWGS